MIERDDGLRELQTFVVRLGAALNAAGEPVYAIQDRLTRIAHAYGAKTARISAFPTYLMVAMGHGEPTALELTSVAASPRLDQIAATDRLAQQAERGAISASDGLRVLADIRELHPRFGPVQSILGYATLALGICLVLHPAAREVAAAAVFGGIVGLLRSLGRGHPTAVDTLMPVLAAFTVAALNALAVKHGLTEPGLRALVASLVVFLPGATLTTAVLELAAGQMVSGASRLVSGIVQLALLAFGILAGVQAVGVPPAHVLRESPHLLGSWAPWLGVLVFALGVRVAHSAPTKALPGLLVVLYAAWAGQVVGNALLGGYVSAFVGALVMTPVAYWVARLPSAMPQSALFLPGYWLLVPGALGLIGLTELAGDASAAGTQDLIATIVTLFAVAVGVLTGTLLLASTVATRNLVGEMSDSIASRRSWFARFRPHSDPEVGPEASGDPDRQ
jgi:uncharacterized membrane protein YjjP (DUF1212 family)